MPKYFAAIVAHDMESTTGEFDCYGCALRWGAARIASWDAPGWTVGVVGGDSDQYRKQEAEHMLIATRSHSGRQVLHTERRTLDEH